MSMFSESIDEMAEHTIKNRYEIHKFGPNHQQSLGRVRVTYLPALGYESTFRHLG